MCSSMRAKKTGAALKESRMLIVKKLGELVLSHAADTSAEFKQPFVERAHAPQFPPFQSAEKAATFYWHIWQLLFPSPLLPKKLLWWRKKVCPDISLQNSADFFFAPAISGEERVVKIAKQKFFFIFGGNISGHFKVGPVSRDTLFCPSFSGASLWETGGKGSGKKSLIRVRDAYFFSTKTEAALLEIILLTSPSSPPFFIRAISW